MLRHRPGLGGGSRREQPSRGQRGLGPASARHGRREERRTASAGGEERGQRRRPAGVCEQAALDQREHRRGSAGATAEERARAWRGARGGPRPRGTRSRRPPPRRPARSRRRCRHRRSGRASAPPAHRALDNRCAVAHSAHRHEEEPSLTLAGSRSCALARCTPYGRATMHRSPRRLGRQRRLFAGPRSPTHRAEHSGHVRTPIGRIYLLMRMHA